MQESILTTLVLPIALATIMLGLGLSLKSDDFLRILVAKEWTRLPGFIVQAGTGVMLLNVLGMAAGFAISKMLKLNVAQQICVATEVGIQNGTLALA